MPEGKEIRVLFVDDERQNTDAFRAALRREFTVVTANSGAEALQLMEKELFHVVISDQKMPEMTGVQFLEIVARQWPDSARILLTAYADIQVVVDAVNKGRIDQYIEKPWKEEELIVSITNAYSIYKNKTDLREKHEALLDAYQELDYFLYMATHDLRAPLLSVKGLIELCQINPNRSQEYLGLIDKSVKRLDTFIINLITYYKGIRVQQTYELIDLRFLIQECLESIRYFDGFDKVRFDTEFSGETSFYNSRVRLSTIFFNLISNAVKYRDPSKEESVVRVTGEIKDGWLLFSVYDNGIGIEKDNLNRVFELFSTGSRKTHSAGLGLHIVREAVKASGGTVDVHSELGKFTEFVVRIPMASQTAVADPE